MLCSISIFYGTLFSAHTLLWSDFPTTIMLPLETSALKELTTNFSMQVLLPINIRIPNDIYKSKCYIEF